MNLVHFTALSIAIMIQLLCCCAAIPFFMSSVNTVPKRMRYQQLRSPLPALRNFKRIDPLLESSNKYDNVMFPDAHQYIEQQQMRDTDASDLHPIYVLPPPNFTPIVYPTSRVDGVQPGKLLANKDLTLTLTPRTYPYPYPHGFSSWILGGTSGMQRGNYWEQLSSDLALHNPVKPHPNRILVYVKRTIPIGQPSWMKIPEYEVHSVAAPQNDNKLIKSKLPVGLTSFFLGGMRGVSGRHWKMPPALVQQVEFMPNDGQPFTDADKNKTVYKPAVQFDDESDLYNVIKHD